MQSSKQRRPKAPRWIDRLWLFAALFTFVVLSLAVWYGKKESAQHRGKVADISVHLGGRIVREHCTTCHVAGARPDSPSATHPDITPHRTESLGCTGCHLGEGMALDLEISHGLPEQGARAVLKGDDVLASCYTCHELTPLKGAEKPWRGYTLFLDKACDTCHYLGGIGMGGRFGPDLTRIGSQLSLPLISEAIRSPSKQPPNSKMPRYPLSRRQTKNLSYFLKSRIGSPPFVKGTGSLAPEAEGEGPALSPGETWLKKGKCLACHQFRDQDGRIAPDLTYIGALRDNRFLKAFLENPTRLVPDSAMPTIPLPPEGNEELVSFLASDVSGPLKKRSPKHLYMALCQRCHAANGDGHGLIEKNLATFPRAFADNAIFFRQVSEERLFNSIERGVPGTSMPPYGKLLTEKERERLLDLVYTSFVAIERSDKVRLPPTEARPETPMSLAESETLFSVKCSRCHGLSGTGKGKEYLEHLPRPRNLTNRPFFSAVSDDRIAHSISHGVAGTAMPAFAEELSSEQMWGLVDKVRHLSGTDKKGP